MSDCRFGSGDIITEKDLPRLLEGSCDIEPGAIIRLYYQDEPSGHVVLKPDKPKRHKMNEASGIGSGIAVPAPAPAAPAPLQVAAPVAVAPAAPAASTAAPIDVNALTQATGGNGGVAVVLALIAVAGGTAGWKFWQKLSEQKHELKMKEMEMQASNTKDKSPGQCTAVHAQHEARLAALEGKVATVQQNNMAFDADFDPSDLKKRLVKLEKALKTKKAEDE